MLAKDYVKNQFGKKSDLQYLECCAQISVQGCLQGSYVQGCVQVGVQRSGWVAEVAK